MPHPTHFLCHTLLTSCVTPYSLPVPQFLKLSHHPAGDKQLDGLGTSGLAHALVPGQGCPQHTVVGVGREGGYPKPLELQRVHQDVVNDGLLHVGLEVLTHLLPKLATQSLHVWVVQQLGEDPAVHVGCGLLGEEGKFRHWDPLLEVILISLRGGVEEGIGGVRSGGEEGRVSMIPPTWVG